MLLLKRVRRNFRGFAGRDEIEIQTLSEQRDVPEKKDSSTRTAVTNMIILPQPED
jgi:hypothetical protein